MFENTGRFGILAVGFFVLACAGSSPGADKVDAGSSSAADVAAGGQDAPDTVDAAASDAGSVADGGGGTTDSTGALDVSIAPDSGSVADGGVMDGIAIDGSVLDGGQSQDAGAADSGSAPVDGGPPAVDGGPAPDVVGAAYVLGECTPGAKGYGSCLIQGWLACLQPQDKCEFTEHDEAYSVTWANGSTFDCVVDIKTKVSTCTGAGPDGKPCMVFAVDAGSGPVPTAKLVALGQTYTMTFTAAGGIEVTCPNGKVEKYADEGDLCSPMELDECSKAGGGKSCPPTMACKPDGTCPAGYTCDATSGGCLTSCAPDSSCPDCYACDAMDGLCHPFP